MKTITVQIPDDMPDHVAIEKFSRLFNDDWITDWWHISDVQAERPALTDEQAREVLNMVACRRDAEIGINWQFIYAIADMLFDKPEELLSCADD
jgi:phage pi2 protein 07